MGKAQITSSLDQQIEALVQAIQEFPGDTVHYGNESWPVEYISVAVGERLQTMEITSTD